MVEIEPFITYGNILTIISIITIVGGSAWKMISWYYKKYTENQEKEKKEVVEKIDKVDDKVGKMLSDLKDRADMTNGNVENIRNDLSDISEDVDELYYNVNKDDNEHERRAQKRSMRRAKRYSIHSDAVRQRRY